ncbi:MAG TPA: DUF2188 domain-containing protein [Ignavibacteria bacterium]|nr:DUF2188 domain-containing protein [Ignavibacteria bacterium]HMR42114.1 DUF2188 domain-containing protein [Ignavibacteria bacterium]
MNRKSKNNRNSKVHIITKKDGKWIVKGKTKLRASLIASSEEMAILLGKNIARNQGSDLYILKGKKMHKINCEVPKERKYLDMLNERRIYVDDY